MSDVNPPAEKRRAMNRVGEEASPIPPDVAQVCERMNEIRGSRGLETGQATGDHALERALFATPDVASVRATTSHAVLAGGVKGRWSMRGSCPN